MIVLGILSAAALIFLGALWFLFNAGDHNRWGW